ncbi:putative high affinity sulfate transporter (SulP) protein [Corchorus olitorius]|uniref:High affinity sulfate transporter (SulP) protein n=1 Tax=Corchorus olitorius TaxID=93759 RepID=A0A1R3GAM9_9ROSI|nr:putative high affinity sulfate transporter (SulP) protein [Corchorus olitorius]
MVCYLDAIVEDDNGGDRHPTGLGGVRAVVRRLTLPVAGGCKVECF